MYAQIISMDGKNVEDATMAECRTIMTEAGKQLTLVLQENPYGYALYQYRIGNLR